MNTKLQGFMARLNKIQYYNTPDYGYILLILSIYNCFKGTTNYRVSLGGTESGQVLHKEIVSVLAFTVRRYVLVKEKCNPCTHIH